MKKLLALLIVLSGLSFAQDSSPSPWGVYGGLTSAGSSDSDGRISGLSFGGSYTINENGQQELGYQFVVVNMIFKMKNLELKLLQKSKEMPLNYGHLTL